MLNLFWIFWGLRFCSFQKRSAISLVNRTFFQLIFFLETNQLGCSDLLWVNHRIWPLSLLPKKHLGPLFGTRDLGTCFRHSPCGRGRGVLPWWSCWPICGSAPSCRRVPVGGAAVTALIPSATWLPRMRGVPRKMGVSPLSLEVLFHGKPYQN